MQTASNLSRSAGRGRGRTLGRAGVAGFLWAGAVATAVAGNVEARMARAMRSDAARQGCRHAQFELGERYARGEGVPRDGREAVLWWIKAARQAHPEAAARLADRIERGDHMPRDPARAEAFWRRAADWGSATAQWRLAQRSREPEEALDWLRSAAEQGHPEALHTLARHAEEGRHMPQDAALSRRLYRQAAEAGHAGARNTYGVLLAEGAYGTPNTEAAFFWFHLAAEAGIRAAERNREALSPRFSLRERRRIRRWAEAYRRGEDSPPEP